MQLLSKRAPHNFMKSKFLTVIGALILGALGSGLWELIKPLFVWASTASLDVVTLGLDSLRDGLYADAASLEAERVSYSILSAITGIVTGVIVSALMFSKLKRRDKENMDLVMVQDPVTRKATFHAKIARLQLIRTIAISLVALSLSAQVFMAQRTIYISRAAAHFNRLCAIAEPHINQGELALIKSSFAQISTRAEYIDLTKRLSAIISANKAKVPEFLVY
jgi:hypothetical protein